jgi:hypothetical protein
MYPTGYLTDFQMKSIAGANGKKSARCETKTGRKREQRKGMAGSSKWLMVGTFAGKSVG